MGMRLFRHLSIMLVLFGSALGHRPIETNMYLTMRLAEEHIEVEMDAANFLIPPLHHLKFEEELPADLTELGDALLAWMATNCPVVVDGVELEPELNKLEFEKLFGATHLADFKNLIMVWSRVRYPLTEKPKRIEFLWDAYVPEPTYGWDGIADPDQEPDEVAVQFKVYDKFRYFNLSPREPGYIWRAEPTPPDLAALSAVEEEPRRLHLLSFVVAGLGVLLALLLVRRHVPSAIFAVLAGLVWAVLAWPVTMELSAGTPRVPSPEAAETSFRALLTNVYQAFDYAEEEDIYDALARSVDGPLLGKLYGEIHRSLVLEDDNGVQCRVEKLEITKAAFSEAIPLAEGVEGYTIESDWEVLGKVSHYGHTHERLNKYGATFMLEPRGRQWKICEINITDQKRIDPQERAEAEEEAQRDGWPNDEVEAEFDPTKPSL